MYSPQKNHERQSRQRFGISIVTENWRIREFQSLFTDIIITSTKKVSFFILSGCHLDIKTTFEGLLWKSYFYLNLSSQLRDKRSQKMTLNFEEDRALLNTDCIKDVQIMLSFAEWPIFYKKSSKSSKKSF